MINSDFVSGLIIGVGLGAITLAHFHAKFMYREALMHKEHLEKLGELEIMQNNALRLKELAGILQSVTEEGR